MADGILSVKLRELDEKLNRLHRRIQRGETAGHSWVCEQCQALYTECAANEHALLQSLQHSKSKVASRLAENYRQIEQTICQARGIIVQSGTEAASVDEKILTAEYALDFAVLAADHALLFAMEAMDAQMLQQEKEETTL